MAVAKDMADNAKAALAEAETPDGDDKTVNTKLVGRRRSEKEKAERVRDEVERYCERFEKEVLRLFDRSYRKGDPRMMAVSSRERFFSERSSLLSIVRGRCKISTAEHPACKSTSINTISSSLRIASSRKRRNRLREWMRMG
jgi:hypothetical protein